MLSNTCLNADSVAATCVADHRAHLRFGRALQNTSTLTPQPVLFNLCVAAEARRSGVASDLVRRCEEQVRSWGEGMVFLKVREDNEAARQLYVSEGYTRLEGRPAPELPGWQERWKGGALPLELMSKQLSSSSGEVVPVKRPTDFNISLEKVLAYNDGDALIWFTLLVLRNRGALTPAYRALPVAAGLVTWLLFYLTLVPR